METGFLQTPKLCIYPKTSCELVTEHNTIQARTDFNHEDRITTPMTSHQKMGTILLVDDEEIVRNIGKLMIEGLGYKVICAHDGPQAIELYRDSADDICCVILDLSMPKMDGDEVFHELRKINRDVRVAMSSGCSHTELAERFSAEDMPGFIQKPYGHDKLASLLQEILPDR